MIRTLVRILTEHSFYVKRRESKTSRTPGVQGGSTGCCCRQVLRDEHPDEEPYLQNQDSRKSNQYDCLNEALHAESAVFRFECIHVIYLVLSMCQIHAAPPLLRTHHNPSRLGKARFVSRLQTCTGHSVACYNGRMLRARFFTLGLLILLCTSMLAIGASAQDIITLRAYAADVDSFPRIAINVSVSDDNGQLLQGLQTGDFAILEDGERIDAVDVEEERLGTRLVYAINTNIDLRVRDASGQSRYEQIRNALLAWWQLPEASELGVDDLSLLTQESMLVPRSDSTAELAATLDAFEPTFQEDVDGYAFILEALNLLYDAPQNDLPTFLIFATPILPSNAELPLDNIISQANEIDTAIFPIVLTSSDDPEQPGIEPLRTIAEATGGGLIIFDPDEGLLSLAAQVLSFRDVYRLSYDSRVQSAGDHSIQIEAALEEGAALSEPQIVSIAVEAPDVVFIQPPLEIVRSSDDTGLPLSEYPPTEQSLEVLITFPDGFDRAITRTALYVNDVLVSERTEAPFDQFVWDLSDVLEPGTYALQAEVEDELGLVANTISHRVQLDVDIPPSGIAALGPALGSLLGVFALLIIGIASVTILLTWIRRQRQLQPVPQISPGRAILSSRRSNLLNEALQAPIEAHLMWPDDEDHPERWIPLTGAAYSLGSDPSVVPFPIIHPSVSGLHANLKRNAAGEYILRDQGSSAGTWINYEPVDQTGSALKHGDRIHLGRVELRFMLDHPPETRHIQTTDLREDMAVHPTAGENA